MDGTSLDRIARLLGSATSRRASVRIALGAMAAAGARATAGKGVPEGGPWPAGPCGPTGKDNRCKKDKECCTGYCRPGNKGKISRCRCAPRNYPCTNRTVCCAQMICLNGACNSDTRVPTGQPCVAETSVCKDAAAECRAYDSDSVDGTFCLLPTAAACSSSVECWSQNCASGVCVAVTCDVCDSGCDFSTIEAAIATPPADGRIRVAPGTYAMASTSVTSTLRVEACGGASGVTVATPAGFDAAFKAESGGKLTVKNLTFTFGGGGAVHASGADEANRVAVTVTGCTMSGFTSNVAYSGYGYFDAVLRDSTLTNARVDIGSADNADRCSMLIERSTITGTTGGPGIELTDNVDLTIVDSTISNGAATEGGAIAVIGGENHSPSSGSVTMSGSTTISANNGTSKGGGMFLRPNNGNTIALTMQDDATIVSNTSPHGSGIAAWLNAGTLTVTGANGRVTGNTGSPAQCEKTSDLGANWLPVADCESF